MSQSIERSASLPPVKSSDYMMVGIAEAKFTNIHGKVLCAPNLGSCLGVAVYDPRLKVCGMMHCLLPAASKDPVKAETKPYMYVDSGLSKLLNEFQKKGSRKSDLTIVAAGCAAINDKNGYFNIGKKNHTVFRKLIWKNQLLVKSEDVGGGDSRTLLLFVENGTVWMKTAGKIFKMA